MRPPAFSLQQLRYFLAVAETGKIRAAAERLHVSETGLSSALSALEADLGVQLLTRRKAHGVALTPSGIELIAQARAVVAAAEDLAERASGHAGVLTGRLVVGIYTTVGPFLLPGVLERFTERHPAVELRVFEASQAELQVALREGRCEAALTYDVGLAPDIAVEPLYRLYPHIMMAASHPMASQPQLALADVAQEPFVLFDVSPARAKVEEIFRRHGVAPNIVFASPNFELVRALVAQRFGLAVLFQQPAAAVSYEGLPLVARRIGSTDCAADVVLAARRDLRPTRRALAFRNICREAALALER